MDPVGSPGHLQPAAIPSQSMSCPADLANVNTDSMHLSEDQQRALAKERQKKDNHNMSKFDEHSKWIGILMIIMREKKAGF